MGKTLHQQQEEGHPCPGPTTGVAIFAPRGAEGDVACDAMPVNGRPVQAGHGPGRDRAGKASGGEENIQVGEEGCWFHVSFSALEHRPLLLRNTSGSRNSEQMPDLRGRLAFESVKRL